MYSEGSKVKGLREIDGDQWREHADVYKEHYVHLYAQNVVSIWYVHCTYM